MMALLDLRCWGEGGRHYGYGSGEVGRGRRVGIVRE